MEYPFPGVAVTGTLGACVPQCFMEEALEPAEEVSRFVVRDTLNQCLRPGNAEITAA